MTPVTWFTVIICVGLLVFAIVCLQKDWLFGGIMSMMWRGAVMAVPLVLGIFIMIQLCKLLSVQVECV